VDGGWYVVLYCMYLDVGMDGLMDNYRVSEKEMITRPNNSSCQLLCMNGTVANTADANCICQVAW